ncbi:hypothetical protein B0H21DRAFT_692809 [Amylocystis lapponica]|nr:hypothetical protein B0H21DRAFT_692809 [Amylocystis lapponica]
MSTSPIQDAASSSNPIHPVTHPDIQQIRKLCPRFRVLIMGRANAGKTTIVQKVCKVGPEAKPVMYSENGFRVCILATRGKHDINDQITYENSNFVFHDSRGFESASIKELEKVKKFMDAHSDPREPLRTRLHVIWYVYCIPVDNTRPVSAAELSFFSYPTGYAPVIVVFTKFDAQISMAYAKCKNKFLPEESHKAWTEAEGIARDTLENIYWPLLQQTLYPPKTYVCLQDMQDPQSNCLELIETTAGTLELGDLHNLFITVQQNVQLSVKNVLQ